VGSVRVPVSGDTRLLVAGVAAFVGLVIYLAVAFAHTHASLYASVPISKVAPWSPSASRLVAVPRRKHRGFDVRVTPASRARSTAGSYGAVVQTLIPYPKRGRTYVVGLWLRGAPGGRIAVEINEFQGAVSRYPVQTSVRATPVWHHFTFSVRVKGSWLGLAMYVYRPNQRRRTWFTIRGLTAAIRGR
jgi:hypothetical protein